ncbi:MAG: hypothetical protein M0Z94_16065 [Dehalococcoidales bacterium]|nr:hypothetical protein [Dehalococcoidales bacterium]
MEPRVNLRYAERPGEVDAGGTDQHRLELIRGPMGWRLLADDYRDEMKLIHPVGTNWAQLQANLGAQMAE